MSRNAVRSLRIRVRDFLVFTSQTAIVSALASVTVYAKLFPAGEKRTRPIDAFAPTSMVAYFVGSGCAQASPQHSAGTRSRTDARDVWPHMGAPSGFGCDRAAGFAAKNLPSVEIIIRQRTLPAG